ncbi:MAG: hypothetical protein ACK4RV_08100 [Caulobacter sp.]
MTVIDPAAARRFETDRTLALINYALLFSAVFFAGVPGLVAVVIAYAQRGGADPGVANHYRFQIQIFWISFLLGLIAGICGLWAVLDVAGQVWGTGGPRAITGEFDLGGVRVERQIISLTIAAVVSLILMVIWLLAAPAIGFIRLITQAEAR